MSKIGRWLFELRRTKDMRLMEVAQELGVSKSFLSQVESGSKLFPEGWLESISALFGVTVEWLKEQVEVDKQAMKVKKALLHLDFSNRSQMVALARTLDDEGLLENIQFMGKLMDKEGHNND